MQKVISIRGVMVMACAVSLAWMAIGSRSARANDAHAEPATTPSTLPTLPTETKLKIFLLVGQSNMSGRGFVEAEDQAIDPRVWRYSRKLGWIPATEPMHGDRSKISGVGPGRAFGIAIADAEPGTTIGLIPAAVGGTAIERWVPESDDLFKAAVKDAKKALQHGELAGILWHQGEANSVHAEHLDGYEGKLMDVVAGFRRELNAPNCPVVVGQIGRFLATSRPASVDFNRRIVAFAATQPNMLCVTSEGLTDIGDAVHFNAKSQRELGHRYAAAYLRLIAATQPTR